MLWSCPGSLTHASAGALLRSGPCVGRISFIKRRYTFHGSGKTAGCSGAPQWLSMVPVTSVFRRDGWYLEFECRRSSTQGEPRARGGSGHPCGVTWQELLWPPAAPSTTPCAPRVTAAVAVTPWMLYRVHSVPYPAEEHGDCLRSRAVLQNLSTSRGSRRSLARWQCQLLIRTVTAPASRHFRAHNKVFMPFLLCWP